MQKWGDDYQMDTQTHEAKNKLTISWLKMKTTHGQTMLHKTEHSTLMTKQN